MNVYFRIDINIVAMILLIAVFIIAYHRLDRKDSLNRRFLSVSVIIVIEILMETITCLINGQSGQLLQVLSGTLHTILFITAPILTCSWFFFIRKWILPDLAVSAKERILLLTPVILNSFLALLSPIFGWIFFITSSNLYLRGSFFIVSAGITYFYLLYALTLIEKNKDQIMKHEFLPMLGVGILPILGGLAQTLFYGILLMWSSTAFSLVLVYIFLQQRMIHLDYLTGAWTRESLNNFMSRKLKKGVDAVFGAIYLDIDGLKQINDQFGHLEGDIAIQTTIDLIKTTLRKTDVIARVGGDEFIIVVNCKSMDTLEKMIERIKAKLIAYNKKSGKEYHLECSFGADVFHSSESSIEQFIHKIDALMYSDKKRKVTQSQSFHK